MSAIDDGVFFVWREDQRGRAVPQIWSGLTTFDGKKIPTLAVYPLSNEDAWAWRHDQLTIEMLCQRYPAPAPAPAEPKVKL